MDNTVLNSDVKNSNLSVEFQATQVYVLLSSRIDTNNSSSEG